MKIYKIREKPVYDLGCKCLKSIEHSVWYIWKKRSFQPRQSSPISVWLSNSLIDLSSFVISPYKFCRVSFQFFLLNVFSAMILHYLFAIRTLEPTWNEMSSFYIQWNSTCLIRFTKCSPEVLISFKLHVFLEQKYIEIQTVKSNFEQW